MKEIKIKTEEIIAEVEFADGAVLKVGDLFDDGRIIMFELVEDGVVVVLGWGYEGWSVVLDNNGKVIA
jgi:hypothetical protein